MYGVYVDSSTYVRCSVLAKRWFNDREWMVEVTYPCGTRVEMTENDFDQIFGISLRGEP